MFTSTLKNLPPEWRRFNLLKDEIISILFTKVSDLYNINSENFNQRLIDLIAEIKESSYQHGLKFNIAPKASLIELIYHSLSLSNQVTFKHKVNFLLNVSIELAEMNLNERRYLLSWELISDYIRFNKENNTQLFSLEKQQYSLVQNSANQLFQCLRVIIIGISEQVCEAIAFVKIKEKYSEYIAIYQQKQAQLLSTTNKQIYQENEWLEIQLIIDILAEIVLFSPWLEQLQETIFNLIAIQDDNNNRLKTDRIAKYHTGISNLKSSQISRYKVKLIEAINQKIKELGQQDNGVILHILVNQYPQECLVEDQGYYISLNNGMLLSEHYQNLVDFFCFLYYKNIDNNSS